MASLDFRGPAIRAVIFDYGKVFTHDADPAAHARMLQVTGLPAPVFDEHYWKYRHDYDAGLMDGPSYWRKIESDTGISLTESEVNDLVRQDIIMWTRLNPVMIAWAEQLDQAGIITGILSNMGWETRDHLLENFSWMAQFHHKTWSCELGIIKPDAAIYRHTCEHLGIAPQQALFLDDKPANVEGAKRAGLNALLFTTPEQLQVDLDREGFGRHLPRVPLHQLAAAHSVP